MDFCIKITPIMLKLKSVLDPIDNNFYGRGDRLNLYFK